MTYAKRGEYRDMALKQVSDIFVKQLQGHCLAEVKGPNESKLEFWSVSGQLVVVQIYKDAGWEYYLQGKEGKVGNIANSVKEYFK